LGEGGEGGEGGEEEGTAGAFGSEGGGAEKKGGLRGERWWRRAGWYGVDVVDVGVRCVKGKGEMRQKLSQILIKVCDI